MQAQELEQLLTLEETATYLRISPSTLYTMRHEGRGPRGFKVGGQVRYRLSDVLDWLEAHADSAR